MAGSRPHRRPGHRSAVAATAVAGLFLTLAGCTAGDPAVPTDAAASSVTSASSLPAQDEQAIRATIDQVNATATGAVADQRATLATVVDPALAAAFDECPAATSTLRFEPVYRDLRPVPGWTTPGGELSGTVYALPSLIRIYTGDRMTGTDLVTLHLGVQAGEAYLTPLCVG